MYLADLDDEQVALVFQHLVTHFDASGELPVTDEEITRRAAEDREFLTAAATYGDTSTAPGEKPSPREILASIAETFPETVPVIEAAAERARRVGTLPLGGVAGEILVIAAVVAILRPRLHLRKSERDGDKELELKASIGGSQSVKDLITLIKQFLGKD